MGVSTRHAWRLLAAYKRDGSAALDHGHLGRRAPNTTPESTRAEALRLAQTRYSGANHTHLSELMREREGMDIGRTTLRRILVKLGHEALHGAMLRVNASIHKAMRRPFGKGAPGGYVRRWRRRRRRQKPYGSAREQSEAQLHRCQVSVHARAGWTGLCEGVQLSGGGGQRPPGSRGSPRQQPDFGQAAGGSVGGGGHQQRRRGATDLFVVTAKSPRPSTRR